jgi:hypothetical protein
MKERLVYVLIGILVGGLIVAVFDKPKYEIHLTNQADLVRFNPRTGEAWVSGSTGWHRIPESP